MQMIKLFRYLIFVSIFSSLYTSYLIYFHAKAKAQGNSNNVVHMGSILIGYNSTFNLYISLKSILLHRTTPLYFHVLTDTISKSNLKTIFRKWKIPNVTVEYYNINSFPPMQYNKLTFFKIMDALKTNKIIVFDADTIFNCNVLELWNMFHRFGSDQAIGLLNNWRKSKRHDIILYHFDHLKETQRKTLSNILSDTKLIQHNEEVAAAFTKTYPNIIHSVSLNYEHSCMVNDDIKSNHTAILQYNGSLLRNSYYSLTSQNNNLTSRRMINSGECSDFEKTIAYNWRILPYVKSFEPDPFANVTLVSQLSYDRIHMLQEISLRWKGSMSLTLYVTDAELIKSLKFIEDTESLANRSNVAYHVVFKESLHHPINVCRNVAWGHATTPFVFLSDIDFIPTQDLDIVLEKQLNEEANMTHKALVVPVLQTINKYHSEFPKYKNEAVKLFNSGRIVQAGTRFRRAHAPTNYKFWKTATKPYRVTWKPGYEPYVMVSFNSVKYDERFVGYGFDKASHILHLYLLGYIFYVLPDTFMIHKNHPGSKEAKEFRKWKAAEKGNRYKRCLYNVVIRNAAKDLQKLCNNCDMEKLFALKE